MRQDYKILSISIIIFTCIYVGRIFLFGVHANSTQQCIPNGERWIGWECLPREYSLNFEQCPTPLTLFGGCKSGEFAKVQPFPICPKRNSKPSCSLDTVKQKGDSLYKERNI